MIRPSAILLMVVATLAGQVPSDYQAAHAAWRAERQQALAIPDGWFSLVGLAFLNAGATEAGSDPDLPIVLPSEAVPPRAGVFRLVQGMVSFQARPGVRITLQGQPVTEVVLKTDADGAPDVLEAGTLRFHVIRRGDRFAVRVKDTASPALAAFKGVEAFPPDLAFRVTGVFKPFPKPQQVPIPTVLGTTELMTSPGLVTFRLKGRRYTLQPVQEGGPDAKLFFIFRDATAGVETYPAGRFLYADPPQDGKVVLDFNRAINPPCAFTTFATCPLPPKRNQLALRVTAGEKTYGSH